MTASNGFSNNKFVMNIVNSNGNNRTLFGGNNKRIPSSRVFVNQNKKQNSGNRIRLSSAVVNNTIPFNNNNNSNKKKKRLNII